MMRHAYECIKSNPCDTSNGCREVNGLCVYIKKNVYLKIISEEKM